MKQIKIAVLTIVILAVSTMSMVGCGCNNTNNDTNGISDKPATDVIGEWGERSDDVTVEFNNDGTCTIGGVQGTYDIDENNTLTVTPNGDNQNSSSSMTFQYYNTDDENFSVPADQWSVTDETLYINGHQYNKGDTSSIDNNANSTESSSSNLGKDDIVVDDDFENIVTDETLDSSSSNDSSSSSSSSSSITGDEETEMDNIYINLDDF